MKHVIRASTGALLACMLAAGCSTKPSATQEAVANTALGNAGQAIDRAAADPHVAKYATGELDRATGELDKAKNAWRTRHDLGAATHFAYLAQQRATMAQELANTRASEDSAKVAVLQRDQAASLAMARRAAPASAAPPQQAFAGFLSGTAKLPPDAMPTLDALASTLKRNPQRIAIIEGHTDDVGSPDTNQALAMKRAEAVRTALIRRGVDSSRIAVRALGEQAPLASNDSDAGRRENRRAQIFIADRDTLVSAGQAANGSTAQGSSTGSTSATSSGGAEEASGQAGQPGRSDRQERQEQRERLEQPDQSRPPSQ